ncbi:MAG: T9SS type A sorting domain-containing protein [Cyanothece sp. SIO1E1]|nr:T9SS type A sorting domain-containing protein [Cyanothece sp. SIO1E1]
MQKYLLCRIWQLPVFLILISATSSTELSAQISYSLDSFILYAETIDKPRVRGLVLEKNQEGRATLLEEHTFVNAGITDKIRHGYSFHDNGRTATYTRFNSFFPVDSFYQLEYIEYNESGDRVYRHKLSDYEVSSDPPTLEIEEWAIDTVITDEQGRIIERLFFKDGVFGRYLDFRNVLVWKEDKLDSVYYYYTDAFGELMHSQTVVYEYEPNGTGRSFIVYNSSGERNYQRIFSYVPSGEIDSIVQYTFSGADTTHRLITSYEYQPFQRERTYFSTNYMTGDTIIGTQYTYTYLTEDRQYTDEVFNKLWDGLKHEFELITTRKNFYSILSSQEEIGHGLDIRAYPNPVNTRLFFKVDPGFAIKTIQVFNAEGQALKYLNWTGDGIDTQTWPNGLYVILINGQISTKVLVQH